MGGAGAATPGQSPAWVGLPKETTFFRLLSNLNSRALGQALLDWQNHVLGPHPAQDDQVAVAGKELLKQPGGQIVSADTVKGRRWLGSELVTRKSNEIPAAQALLRRAPIAGRLVTADALHTQTETARIIVQERGADYRMTVQGSQPTVADTGRQLPAGLTRAFSPSVGGGPGAAGETEPGPSGGALSDSL